jgi:hypothetical protein
MSLQGNLLYKQYFQLACCTATRETSAFLSYCIRRVLYKAAALLILQLCSNLSCALCIAMTKSVLV